MTTATATETDRVLVDMLTENTGRSILDSGGAYGRNWERNQGREVESFLAEPEASQDWDYVSLSVFHWLRNRLEFDPQMDRRLELWTALRSNDDPWLVEAETFAAAWEGHEHLRVYNSYNEENCLSQDIQWVEIGERGMRGSGDQWVLLQIHGGCDARGGYTRPRAFRVLGDSFGWDMGSYSLYCDHEEEDPDQLELFAAGWHETQHFAEVRGGEITDRSGSFNDPWAAAGVEMWVDTTDADYVGPETDRRYIAQCPYCAGQGRVHRPMEPNAPYSS